jgi:hypothetical protein
MPSPFDGLSTTDLLRVQKKIATGEWRADARSPAWAGNAVAEILSLDVSETSVREKIKKLLDAWIKNRALKKATRPDQHRVSKEFVEVGQWANT